MMTRLKKVKNLQASVLRQWSAWRLPKEQKRLLCLETANKPFFAEKTMHQIHPTTLNYRHFLTAMLRLDTFDGLANYKFENRAR